MTTTQTTETERPRIRATIPRRCNRLATAYAANGYRSCVDHADGAMVGAAGEFIGRCDYPTDGLGAARYQAATDNEGTEE